MFLLLFIFLLLATAAAIGVIVRFRAINSLPEQRPAKELPRFRPLFEPTEDELRAETMRENAVLAEMEEQESLKLREKKLANFERLRQTWANSKDRSGTVELLYQASQTANGEIYLETCEHVLKAWRAGDIGELSADDLAQLLESHLWLLPDSARTPGVSFRMKEEIAGLRREFVQGK